MSDSYRNPCLSKGGNDMFKDLKVLLSNEEYVRLDEEAKEKGMPTMIYIRRLLLGDG